MVAVDDGTAQLGTDLIKLVAEGGHLVGAVLIAGDDLIDGVDDDGNVALLRRSTDEFRRQLVHGDGVATQVPNGYAVLGRRSHGLSHVPEPVQAGRPVQLQIDIHDLALSAFESHPG